MSIRIPTTAEIAAQAIAKYQAALNQTVPPVDKSFLNVQSGVEALLITGLYKFALERSLQNLALTASGADLERLGSEYGVNKKLAEAAVYTIELPAVTGTNIPGTSAFIGDDNGERYTMSDSVIAAAGVAIILVTAENPGVSGNLDVGSTMSIDSQVSGAETTATITVIENIGTEEEAEEAYRQRILDQIRAVNGGGNIADYRKWSEEVAGVFRAYPYAGNPVDLITNDGSSVPPERTVFIEADTSIDEDGIAPQGLLDEVRESITADPVTGIERQPLGLTDDTLFVESIRRTGFYVRITGLSVDPAQEGNAKADIEDAISLYFRTIKPFISGLDPSFTKNDLITQFSLSTVIDDVLVVYGASALAVGFGITLGVFLSSYTLGAGELAKLIQVDYI